MQAKLSESLRAELAHLEAADLRRSLPTADDLVGDPRLDFCSNDYLSLARLPFTASAQSPRGTGAARLLGGTLVTIDAVEKLAANWLGEESALIFPSGYQANLALLAAIARRSDILVLDAAIHASAIDGARLSRAKVLVHRHLDLNNLEDKLRQAQAILPDEGRLLIATESVFSMSGEGPDFGRLDELAQRHQAHLIVDEAHAVGVLGEHGQGIAPSSCYPSVAARIATGGKALGAAGAFVVGDQCLVDLLVNRGRGFIFSTGVFPRLAQTLLDSIQRAEADTEGRQKLAKLKQSLCRQLGIPEPRGSIVFLNMGDEKPALAAAALLQNAGFAVRAVRPPTVAPGKSGLRLVLHTHNDEASVNELCQAISDFGFKPTASNVPMPIQSSLKGQRPKYCGSKSIWIVGTDTGVGKTVVSALVGIALAKQCPTYYWKPVQTGDEDDTRRVKELVGDHSVKTTARPRYEFPLPASPHTAAAAAGTTIDFTSLLETHLHLCTQHQDGFLVIELAGGLMVPYNHEFSQADLLQNGEGKIVLVARSGLGTLNHTILTFEALNRRGRTIDALILVGETHPENLRTLQDLKVARRIFELPQLEVLNTSSLESWNSIDDLAEALS
ncbi:MAG: dethiobiotin synthase [Planctomycetota bacterium]